MRVSAKPRFSVFEVMLFLLVPGLGWAAWRAFEVVQQINQVPQTFLRARNEYVVIADRLESTAAQLNRSLFRYADHSDTADWERSRRVMDELRGWLEEQRSAATKVKIIMLKPVNLTVDVSALLDDVERVCSVYVLRAEFVTTSAPATGVRELKRPGYLSAAHHQANELTILAGRARAHAEAIEMFLSTSAQWFPWLRRLMNASLLTLAALALWMAVLIYRRVVSPLRRQLVENNVLLERQQKLAHFGELAAIVAHEIRNPLTAISARLFTLQKSLSRGSSEHEDATVIRGEIHRLNRIVKEFLEQARPAEPQFEPVSARQLLEEVRALYASEYAGKSIDLVIESVTETEFRADAQQLKQVLINLIQNAAESMNDTGAITVRARFEHRSLRPRIGDAVVIEVQDTGPGIPPEVQSRLFDPFFSTKRNGTGLGLSIAARIVAKHSGTIEFQTQRGRGTTFRVVLPACQPAPAVIA